MSNNGIGIPPQLMPKIVDVFVQGPAQLDRAHGGLGIGLALVQRLVTLHGGTVSAYSEGAGKGSSFTVQLPRGSPATRDIRLVAVTGYGQTEDRERTLAAGFDAHLVKPVEPARLLETIIRLTR